MNPHLSYADPDPQNLVNADLDPGQKLQNLFRPFISQEEKIYFQICVLTLEISYFLSFRLKKYNFLQKKLKFVG